MYATEPLTDLEANAKATGATFTSAHFLPHGKEIEAILAELKKRSIERTVQEAMHEDPTKMSRMGTKTVCAAAIKDEHSLITMCANITVFLQSLTSFDTDSVDPDKVPFLHYAARKVGLALSSKEYRHYLDKSHCHGKLHYYVFNVIDRTLTTYFKVLECKSSIAAASNEGANPAGLNANHATMANSCLDHGLQTVMNVCAEAETLKDTAIYSASVYASFNTPVQTGANKRQLEYTTD